MPTRLEKELQLAGLPTFMNDVHAWCPLLLLHKRQQAQLVSSPHHFHYCRSSVSMAAKGEEAPAVSRLADQMQISKDLSLTAVLSRTPLDRRTLTAVAPSPWMPILCHRSVQPQPLSHTPSSFNNRHHHFTRAFPELTHSALSSCSWQHTYDLRGKYSLTEGG